MSRHWQCPSRLRVRTGNSMVSPWLLSLISATCHHAAPVAREAAASTMGLSIALPLIPESGDGGTCPLLSSTARVNSLSVGISIQYIFMLVSPFNCIASPPAHFPAVFFTNKRPIFAGSPSRPFVYSQHGCSKQHQQVSRSLLCVWCSCDQEGLCEQLKKHVG